MNKKSISIFVLVFFFSLSHFAIASVIINEVMYSPASKQWVEIYNDTDSSVDITQYKILDAGASKNGHSISPAVEGGSNIIPAHEYGVVALDVTSVSATHLFHASLGIAKTGDTVILRDTTGVAPDSSVSVPLDSAINGNSLQLINGSWASATPTPGVVNQSLPLPIPTSSDTATSTSSSNAGSSSAPTTTIQLKSKVPEDKIKTQITAKAFGLVGIPFYLQASTFGRNGEQTYSGKYFWNFGDGDSKEVKLTYAEQPFSHTYFYPGDYVVSLDYYQNYFTSSDVPDASNQITIKIIPTDITISKVGDEKDFFIEISNNTDHNADLSNWVLVSDQKSFTIPRNTTIASKQKIIISPKITNFSIADKFSLKLMNPEGETVFDYSSPQFASNTKIRNTANSGYKTPISLSSTSSKILPISTVSENFATNSEKNNQNSTSHIEMVTIFIIFFLFVGTSSFFVYFIRRKRVISQEGNDFEILDE